jgi:hypothetical protein
MNHGTHRRRGWWRSPLFWLGGFGLGFLGWAWIASNQQASKLEYLPRNVEICSTHGHLLAVHLSPAADALFAVDEWLGVVYPAKPWPSGSGTISCYFSPVSPSSTWEFYQVPVHPVQRTWFPPPRFQSSEDSAAPFTLLTIPYWLLVTAYLGVWSALLWRQGRKSARATTVPTR